MWGLGRVGPSSPLGNYISGFGQNLPIIHCFVRLFELCSSCLSQIPHYLGTLFFLLFFGNFTFEGVLCKNYFGTTWKRLCTFTVKIFAVLRDIVGDDFAVTFVITNLLCYLLKTALSFSNVHKTNIVCRVLSLSRIHQIIT